MDNCKQMYHSKGKSGSQIEYTPLWKLSLLLREIAEGDKRSEDKLSLQKNQLIESEGNHANAED